MEKKELRRLFRTVAVSAITAALLFLSACELLSKPMDYKPRQVNPVVPEVNLSLEGIDLEVFTTDPMTPAAEHHLKYTKNEYVVELEFPTEKIRLRANPKAADDVVISYMLDDFTMNRSSDLREGPDGYVEVSMLVYFDVKVQVEVRSGQRRERTTVFLRRHFPDAVLYVDEVNGHDIPDMAAGLSLKAAYKTLNYAFRRLAKEEVISTVVVYHTLTMDSQTNDESVFLINNVGSTEGGKRRILVMGLDASEPGELKATGTGKRVLTVTGDNIRITFMHMKFTGADTSAKDGAGIFVGPGAEVTLGSGTEVRNNTGRNGGGVYVSSNGTLTMQGGSVQSNYANQNGAGVYVSSGATLVMKGQGSVTANGGNGIAQVATVRGGGIYAASGSTMTLEQSVLVAQNVAQVAGGGIYIEGKFAPAAISAWSDVSIEDNRLISNVGEGVGLYLGGDAEVRFASNVRISSNYIQGGSTGFSKGGGIMLSDSAHLTIDSQIMPERQNRVTGNMAASGGGVYLRGRAVFDNGAIIGRTSQANTALVSGGGIYIESGTINFMDNAAVNGNTAADEGGGIYSGISAITFAGNNIQVNDNQAQNGGGLFFAHGTAAISGDSMSIMRNTAKQQGGGIFAGTDSVRFIGKNMSLSNNTAQEGGGLYVSSGTVSFTGASAQIERNTASSSGGGICAAGEVSVTMNSAGGGAGISVSNNTASSGGGVSVSEGAMLSVVNGTFRRNKGIQNGGAIYMALAQEAYPVTLNNTQLTENWTGAEDFSVDAVSGQGGAVYIYRGTLDLANTTFIDGNHAAYGAGVYLVNGEMKIDATSEVRGNVAAYDGGGIFVTNSAIVTMHDSYISANLAGEKGGALYINPYARLRMYGTARIDMQDPNHTVFLKTPDGSTQPSVPTGMIEIFECPTELSPGVQDRPGFTGFACIEPNNYIVELPVVGMGIDIPASEYNVLNEMRNLNFSVRPDQRGVKYMVDQFGHLQMDFGAMAGWAFYVQEGGLDTNVGTSVETPLRTLRKAVEYASDPRNRKPNIIVMGTLNPETEDPTPADIVQGLVRDDDNIFVVKISAKQSYDMVHNAYIQEQFKDHRHVLTIYGGGGGKLSGKLQDGTTDRRRLLKVSGGGEVIFRNLTLSDAESALNGGGVYIESPDPADIDTGYPPYGYTKMIAGEGVTITENRLIGNVRGSGVYLTGRALLTLKYPDDYFDRLPGVSVAPVITQDNDVYLETPDSTVTDGGKVRITGELPTTPYQAARLTPQSYAYTAGGHGQVMLVGDVNTGTTLNYRRFTVSDTVAGATRAYAVDNTGGVYTNKQFYVSTDMKASDWSSGLSAADPFATLGRALAAMERYAPIATDQRSIYLLSDLNSFVEAAGTSTPGTRDSASVFTIDLSSSVEITISGRADNNDPNNETSAARTNRRLDGDNGKRVLKVYGVQTKAVLENITVSGGTLTDPTLNGGGIYVSGAQLTLGAGVLVENNSAGGGRGNGVYQENGALLMRGNARVSDTNDVFLLTSVFGGGAAIIEVLDPTSFTGSAKITPSSYTPYTRVLNPNGDQRSSGVHKNFTVTNDSNGVAYTVTGCTGTTGTLLGGYLEHGPLPGGVESYYVSANETGATASDEGGHGRNLERQPYRSLRYALFQARTNADTAGSNDWGTIVVMGDLSWSAPANTPTSVAGKTVNYGENIDNTAALTVFTEDSASASAFLINIPVGKTVTVRGLYGGTLLNTDAGRRVVRVTGGGTVIFEHINITGGSTTNSGGGILVDGTGTKVVLGEGAVVGKIVRDDGTVVTNLAANGGGVYINGTAALQMKKDARITGNTVTGVGAGVYVNSSAASVFTMTESAEVTALGADANDVYLASTRRITADANLTTANAAKITSSSYTAGTVVLDGANLGTAFKNYNRFLVTDSGTTPNLVPWYVDSAGKLQKQMPTPVTVPVYYVSGTGGDDTFHGLTVERPFKTLSHALSQMQTHVVNNVRILTNLDATTERGADAESVFTVAWATGARTPVVLMIESGKTSNGDADTVARELRGTSGRRVMAIKDNVNVAFKYLTFTGGDLSSVDSSHGGGLHITDNAVVTLDAGVTVKGNKVAPTTGQGSGIWLNSSAELHMSNNALVTPSGADENDVFLTDNAMIRPSGLATGIRARITPEHYAPKTKLLKLPNSTSGDFCAQFLVTPRNGSDYGITMKSTDANPWYGWLYTDVLSGDKKYYVSQKDANRNDDEDYGTVDYPFYTLGYAIERAKVMGVRNVVMMGDFDADVDGAASTGASTPDFSGHLNGSTSNAYHAFVVNLTAKYGTTFTQAEPLVIEGAFDAVLKVSTGKGEVLVAGSGSPCVTFKNLTITGGGGGYGVGGGMYIENSSHVTLSNVKVIDNGRGTTKPLNGGGIYHNSAGTLILEQNTLIEGNMATLTGSGIHMERGTLMMKDTSTITPRTWVGGGTGWSTATYPANDVYMSGASTRVINFDNYMVTDNPPPVRVRMTPGSYSVNQKVGDNAAGHYKEVMVTDQIVSSGNPIAWYVDSSGYLQQHNGFAVSNTGSDDSNGSPALPVKTMAQALALAKVHPNQSGTGKVNIWVLSDLSAALEPVVSPLYPHLDSSSVFTVDMGATTPALTIAGVTTGSGGGTAVRRMPGMSGKRAVQVNDLSNVTFKNIEISDGNITGAGSNGGGIQIESGAAVTLDEGVTVKNNNAGGKGKGIYVVGPSGKLTMLKNAVVTHYNVVPTAQNDVYLDAGTKIYSATGYTGLDTYITPWSYLSSTQVLNVAPQPFTDVVAMNNAFKVTGSGGNEYSIVYLTGKLTTSLIAGDIFVSDAGDDQNVGTDINAPFRTLKRAIATGNGNVAKPEYTIVVMEPLHTSVSNGTTSEGDGDANSAFIIDTGTGKKITLKGAYGGALIGDSGKRVAEITGSSTVIFDGMTISDGNTSGNGAGLYLADAVTATVVLKGATTVTSNTGTGAASLGAGIYAGSGAKLQMEKDDSDNNPVISGNTLSGANAHGTGVYLKNVLATGAFIMKDKSMVGSSGSMTDDDVYLFWNGTASARVAADASLSTGVVAARLTPMHYAATGVTVLQNAGSSHAADFVVTDDATVPANKVPYYIALTGANGNLATSTTYYVNGTTGTDDANGLTTATAFKTVAQALEAIKDHAPRTITLTSDITAASEATSAFAPGTDSVIKIDLPARAPSGITITSDGTVRSISGTAGQRVFWVTGSGTEVTLLKMKIVNGAPTSGDGGGIWLNGAARLTLGTGALVGTAAADKNSVAAGARGAGVYVGDTGVFTMDGTAKVFTDNDVALAMGQTITVKAVSGSDLARITPATYVEGTQILIGTAAQVAAASTKYKITNNGPQTYSIATDGTLKALTPAGGIYYVASAANGGDDANSGTTSADPFRSLGYAVAQAKLFNVSKIAVIGAIDSASEATSYQTTTSVFTINNKISLTIIGMKDGTNNRGSLNGTATKRVLTIGGDATTKVTFQNIDITGGGSGTFAQNGGGISLEENAVLTIGDDAAVKNSYTTKDGGGVYVKAGNLTVAAGGSISGNNAGNGGGIYHLAGVLIIDGALNDNNAGVAGGGLFTVGGTTTIGGSVYNNGVTNTGAVGGGGVYSNNGTVHLYGGSISANHKPAFSVSPTTFGAGVYHNGNFDMKGAASVDSNNDIFLATGKVVELADNLSLTSGTDTVGVLSLGADINYVPARALVRSASTAITIANYAKFSVLYEVPGKPADTSTYVVLPTAPPSDTAILGTPTVFYVKTNGDDANHGFTEDKALKTLAKAVEKVRLAAGTSTPITRIVILDSLTTADNAGAADANTVYTLNNVGTLSIEGKDGVDVVLKDTDAGNKRRVFKIVGTSTVTLKNLTIQDSGKGLTDAGTGGGIWVEGSAATLKADSSVTIKDNGGTTVRLGGGIYLNSGRLELSGTTISGNKAEVLNGAGGGIFANSGSSLLSGVTLAQNTAGSHGGGLALAASHSAVITGGSIENNKANADNMPGYGGGGIHTRDGVTLSVGDGTEEGHVLIVGNEAYYGGGILAGTDTLMLTLNKVTVGTQASPNKTLSGGFGGGICIDNNVGGVFTDCLIQYNSATSDGGLRLGSSSALTLHNTAVQYNTATNDNAGIFLFGSLTLMGNSSVVGNTVTSTLGTKRGAGVTVQGATLTLADDARIEGNTFAGKGEGSGVYMNGGTLILKNNARIMPTGTTANDVWMATTARVTLDASLNTSRTAVWITPNPSPAYGTRQVVSAPVPTGLNDLVRVTDEPPASPVVAGLESTPSNFPQAFVVETDGKLAAVTNYYVKDGLSAPVGDDANDGKSSNRPFASLGRAAYEAATHANRSVSLLSDLTWESENSATNPRSQGQQVYGANGEYGGGDAESAFVLNLPNTVKVTIRGSGSGVVFKTLRGTSNRRVVTVAGTSNVTFQYIALSDGNPTNGNGGALLLERNGNNTTTGYPMAMIFRPANGLQYEIIKNNTVAFDRKGSAVYVDTDTTFVVDASETTGVFEIQPFIYLKRGAVVKLLRAATPTAPTASGNMWIEMEHYAPGEPVVDVTNTFGLVGTDAQKETMLNAMIHIEPDGQGSWKIDANGKLQLSAPVADTIYVRRPWRTGDAAGTQTSYGIDGAGRGTYAAPYATLGYAMSQIPTTKTNYTVTVIGVLNQDTTDALMPSANSAIYTLNNLPASLFATAGSSLTICGVADPVTGEGGALTTAAPNLRLFHSDLKGALGKLLFKDITLARTAAPTTTLDAGGIMCLSGLTVVLERGTVVKGPGTAATQTVPLATKGGGIFVAGGKSGWTGNARLVIQSGARVENCFAINGGGVYARTGTDPSESGIFGTVELRGEVRNNRASEKGGGVYAGLYGGTELSGKTLESVVITGDGKVYGNTTPLRGGGIYVAGDETYGYEATVKMLKGLVYLNTVANTSVVNEDNTIGGAGVYIGALGRLSMEESDSVITSNTFTADVGPGGVGIHGHGSGVYITGGGAPGVLSLGSASSNSVVPKITVDNDVYLAKVDNSVTPYISAQVQVVPSGAVQPDAPFMGMSPGQVVARLTPFSYDAGAAFMTLVDVQGTDPGYTATTTVNYTNLYDKFMVTDNPMGLPAVLTYQPQTQTNPQVGHGVLIVPEGYYVATWGDDSWTGLQKERPYKTLNKAVQRAKQIKFNHIIILDDLDLASSGCDGDANAMFWLDSVSATLGGKDLIITGNVDGPINASLVPTGPAQVTLSHPTRRIFSFTADINAGETRVRLQNLRLANSGKGLTAAGTGKKGGAIYMKCDWLLPGAEPGVQVTLDENVLLEDNGESNGTNGLDAGGAIYVDGAKLVINRNTIMNNSVSLTSGTGGAISVTGNNAQVFIRGYGDAGNGVMLNEAYLGGGVYANGGTITLENARIYANDAVSGGGLYLAGSAKLTVPKSFEGAYNTPVILNNNATSAGGGLYVGSNAAMTVLSLKLTNNNAVNGGAIALGAGANLTLGDATDDSGTDGPDGADVKIGIQSGGNMATTAGGGIWVNGGTLKVESDAIVSYNQASGNGGGIAVLGASVVDLNGLKLYGNSANNGGGVAVTSNSNACKVTIRDGAIGADDTEVTPSVNKVGNSAAALGGGLYIAGTTPGTANDLQVTLLADAARPTIAYNSALKGAGIALVDAGKVGGTNIPSIVATILENEADEAGGGLYAENSSFKFMDGVIKNNSTTAAVSYGGGVRLYHVGTTLPTALFAGTATVEGNTAPYGGGIAVQKYAVTLEGTAKISANGGIPTLVTTQGGGLYVDETTATVTMKTGTAIIGNAAEYGGGAYVRGGTVIVEEGAVIGTSASPNTAVNAGGGAYLAGATSMAGNLVMQGTMTANKLTTNYSAVQVGSGNAVFVGRLAGVLTGAYADPVLTLQAKGRIVPGNITDTDTDTKNDHDVYLSDDASRTCLVKILAPTGTVYPWMLVRPQIGGINKKLLTGTAADITTATSATGTNPPRVQLLREKITTPFTSLIQWRVAQDSAIGDTYGVQQGPARYYIGQNTGADDSKYGVAENGIGDDANRRIRTLGQALTLMKITGTRAVQFVPPAANGSYLSSKIDDDVYSGTYKTGTTTLVEKNIFNTTNMFLLDGFTSELGNFTIEGTNGVFIKGNTRRAFQITDSTVTFKDVKISDSGISNVSNGGALYISQNAGKVSAVTLETGALVQNNGGAPSVQRGGGVYVSGGALTLNTGSKIINNNATLFGGGLYVAGGTVTLNAGAAVEGNAFGTNLSSQGKGGGIYMDGGTVTHNGASIKSNTAARGAGFFQAAGSLTLNGPVDTNKVIDGGNFLDLDGITQYPFKYGEKVYVAPGAVLTLFNTTGNMDNNMSIFLERGSTLQNGAQIRAGNDLSNVLYHLVPTEHVSGIRVLVNEANTTKYYKSFRLPLTDPNDSAFGWVVNSNGLIAHGTETHKLTAMNNNDIPLIVKDSKFWVEDSAYHLNQNTSIVTDAQWNALPDGPVYIGVKRNDVNGTISYYVTTSLNVNTWSDSLGYFRPAANDRVLFALYKKSWNSLNYYAHRTTLTKTRTVPVWATQAENRSYNSKDSELAQNEFNFAARNLPGWIIVNMAGGSGGRGGTAHKGGDISSGVSGVGAEYGTPVYAARALGYHWNVTNVGYQFVIGEKGANGSDSTNYGGAGGGGGGADSYIYIPASDTVWLLTTGGAGGMGDYGDKSGGRGGGGGGGSGGTCFVQDGEMDAMWDTYSKITDSLWAQMGSTFKDFMRSWSGMNTDLGKQANTRGGGFGKTGYWGSDGSGPDGDGGGGGGGLLADGQAVPNCLISDTGPGAGGHNVSTYLEAQQYYVAAGGGGGGGGSYYDSRNNAGTGGRGGRMGSNGNYGPGGAPKAGDSGRGGGAAGSWRRVTKVVTRIDSGMPTSNRTHNDTGYVNVFGVWITY